MGCQLLNYGGSTQGQYELLGVLERCCLRLVLVSLEPGFDQQELFSDYFFFLGCRGGSLPFPGFLGGDLWLLFCSLYILACSGDLLAAGAVLFFSFSGLISGCCSAPSSSFLFGTDVCTAESDTGVCSGDLVWGVGDLADSTLPDDSVLCGSCCTLGDGELREGDGVGVGGPGRGVLHISFRSGEGDEQVL